MADEKRDEDEGRMVEVHHPMVSRSGLIGVLRLAFVQRKFALADRAAATERVQVRRNPDEDT